MEMVGAGSNSLISTDNSNIWTCRICLCNFNNRNILSSYPQFSKNNYNESNRQRYLIKLIQLSHKHWQQAEQEVGWMLAQMVRANYMGPVS